VDVLAVAMVTVTVTVVAAVAVSADSVVQWVLAEVPVGLVDSAAKVVTDSVLQIAAGKHKYHNRFRR